MDIHIREQRLPGIGHRDALDVDAGRKLAVVVEHGGRREVGLVSRLAQEPDAVVSLSEEQAVALAALLSGARFSIDSTDDDQIDADEVVVETITLGPGSPAIGRPVNDISLIGTTKLLFWPSSAMKRLSWWRTRPRGPPSRVTASSSRRAASTSRRSYGNWPVDDPDRGRPRVPRRSSASRRPRRCRD